MKSTTLYLFLAIPILFTSCFGTFRVKSARAIERGLPAKGSLEPGEIITRSRFPVDNYKQLLFVRDTVFFKPYRKEYEYRDFITESFARSGFFSNVCNKETIILFLSSKGLGDIVAGYPLNPDPGELAGAIGNFLYAEANLEFNYDFLCRFSLKVINPSDGSTIYHVSHQAINITGLDRPLFNPVLNDFFSWLRENSNSQPKPGMPNTDNDIDN